MPGLVPDKDGPPRAEKIKLLKKMHAVIDPFSVLENPTLDGMQTVEQVYPETVKHLRTQITSGILDNPDRSYSPAQARRLSILMGVPLNGRMNPAYIARLQEVARSNLGPTPQQKPGPGRPPKVKVSATSANVIAPGSQQNEVEKSQ
jgi:hypothetical protein